MDILQPTSPEEEKATRAARSKKRAEPQTLPAVQEPPTDSFMAMIERLSQSKNVDIEKIKSLMELNAQIIDRNAKAEFAADLVAMKPELPRILKLHENTQTKSRYAKLEDINAQIDPILKNFGFATITKILESGMEGVRVRAELWHRNGHVEHTEIFMPIDNKGPQGTVNKTGPHAISSSTQYAKRVSICALLNISTGDDIDGNRPRTDLSPLISDAQIDELDDWINSTNSDKAKFLLAYKVSSLGEMNVRQFEHALINLQKKEAK